MKLPALPTLEDANAAAGARWRRAPWPQRVREALTAYLPLLLIALLALATWWLVRSTPVTGAPTEPAPARHVADYVMQRYTLQRFASDGRLAVQIEGDTMRHYPDTDTMELDGVRIRALGADGSTTVARAQRAITNSDASEVQLVGGARVRREGGARGGAPLELESEFLHAFLDTERVRSHLPVRLLQGDNDIRAAGIEYDHLTRTAQLKGPVRARFVAPGR